MRHLIGLGYQKQSGKDTVAVMLSELLKPSTVKLFSFGQALYEEVSVATGVSITKIQTNKPLYRPLLQWWGTEFRRGQHDNYWIDKLEKTIQTTCCNYAIITDVRFHNEAQYVIDHGGTLVCVNRGLPDTDRHQSEVEGQDINWGYYINNTGNLEHLKYECKIFVECLKTRS